MNQAGSPARRATAAHDASPAAGHDASRAGRARRIRPGLRLVLRADPGPGAAGRGVLFGAMPAGPAPVPAHGRPRRRSWGLPATPAGLRRPALPGRAHLYRDHPDYGGEAGHAALITQLAGYDGGRCPPPPRRCPPCWRCARPGCGSAAWHRGARPAPARWPLHAWEPVLYFGGRQLTRRRARHDALIRSCAASPPSPPCPAG